MADPDIPFSKAKTVNHIVLRIIIITLVLGLSLFKLFISYRGLDQPVAMDQAQIARQVAQGKGFTTKFLRPMELKTADSRFGKSKEGLNLDAFRDTNHAPLNICVQALALKITGQHKFESHRMLKGKGNVYAADRIISATSLILFLLAMLLSYMLIRRLFDEAVAAASVAFLALSNLMLQYAMSGLPQMLMLCCLLGSLHFMLTATRIDAEGRKRGILLNICLSFICMGLLCLTSWMGLWVALGLVIFCALHFRPYGAMAVPGIIIIVFIVMFPLLGNKDLTGNLAGNAYYALYNCFGSGEDLVQRSTSSVNLPLNNSSLILRLAGYTFEQLNTMYMAMGGIIVTPFFFLCLFNRYKKASTEAIKWATLSMWCFACIGMALYGISTPLNASQLMPLFAPLFTAYGIALTFNFLARLKLGPSFNLARGLTVFIMLAVSAGSFIFFLPKEIYYGLWLRNTAHPHYPPYYPAALNARGTEPGKEVSLADKSNEKDIIVTDQPWAVAWYANRKALWTPLRLDDYTDELEPIINRAGLSVQGFLVTPSSHSPNRSSSNLSRPGGLKGVIMENGDFAPLAMEGILLMMVPKHNMALADFFMTAGNKKVTRPLGTIVSSSGQFPYRHYILGTEIIYYSRQPAR